MDKKFLSWGLDQLVPGEPLPAPIFLLLSERYILYKKQGDLITRDIFDRMEFKKVGCIFIQETDKPVMAAWSSKAEAINQHQLPVSKELAAAREDARRSMMDIFHSAHNNEIVTKTLKTSEKLVTEMMKFPFASKPLSQLQSFSRGTVDHSVNVSVLAVYLAMNMGYTHVIILRHLAAGALLHDVGKSQVGIEDQDETFIVEEKLRHHPEKSLAILEEDPAISKEVKMIVAQHHEHYDGTGYPKGLHGKEIYDLAKIVSIANAFDELVSGSSGTLEERQAHAMKELQGPLNNRFDPTKLTKALKILAIGI